MVHIVVMRSFCLFFFFFFKQKTAYEMRISDWSSDVCSSDLVMGQVDNGRLSERDQKIWDGYVGGKTILVLAQEFDVSNQRISQILREKIGRASCRERVCQYV